MAANEVYPCYVRIGEEESCEEMVELPTEKDGTMLLSTVQAQFPEAIGLRFKGESGGWRGVRISENVMDPPLEGWGSKDFTITLAKKGKRKLDEGDGPHNKSIKMSEEEMLSDLIVLGLHYAATEDDVKNYFEKFGELDMYEIKYDPVSKKSKGFGFIRYKSVDSVKSVLEENHVILNRRCEVKFPKKEDDVPKKLFVGRLPEGTTIEDLQEHFSAYGVLKDVYIPNPFRGFGFITFEDNASVRDVLNTSHNIKGTYVNINRPEPKTQKMNVNQNSHQQSFYGYGTMQGDMQRNMTGNMQGNIPMQQNQGSSQYAPGSGYQVNDMKSGYNSTGYFQSNVQMPNGPMTSSALQPQGDWTNS